MPVGSQVTECRPNGRELTIRTVGPVARVLADPFGWLEDEVIVDLSATRFSAPDGLVALTAAISAAVNIGTTLRVRCPRDAGCNRYLGAAGVIQHWSRLGVSLEGSSGVEDCAPSASSTVLPLTAITSDNDVRDVKLRVTELIERLLGSGDAEWERRRRAFSSAVHEMSTNVIRHTGKTGFVLAQKYRNRGERRDFVGFAVGDAGPGIPATLRTSHKWLGESSDHQVLDRMLQDGLSRGEGGMGYQVVQRFTGQHAGHFALRSGDGSLTLARGQVTPTVSALGWTWPGTVVSGSVTCPQ